MGDTMGRTKTILMLFLVTVFSAPAFADNQKPAFIDMQRALQSVEAGKEAKGRLERRFNDKREELKKKKTKIRNDTENFKKQALVMNEQARAKKQADLQEEILKFQEETARSQGEIQQLQNDLTIPLIKKLREIADKVAHRKGYEVVFDKNDNVVVSPAKDDITNEVISEFNKQYGKNIPTQKAG